MVWHWFLWMFLACPHCAHTHTSVEDRVGRYCAQRSCSASRHTYERTQSPVLTVYFTIATAGVGDYEYDSSIPEGHDWYRYFALDRECRCELGRRWQWSPVWTSSYPASATVRICLIKATCRQQFSARTPPLRFQLDRSATMAGHA